MQQKQRPSTKLLHQSKFNIILDHSHPDILIGQAQTVREYDKTMPPSQMADQEHENAKKKQPSQIEPITS